MKTKVLWALVALNILLLVGLVVRGAGEPAAVAQVPRPSDYLMVPAEVVGAPGSVVYILDLNNRQLGGMTYDGNRRELRTMAPIDLDRVFEEAMGFRP